MSTSRFLWAAALFAGAVLGCDPGLPLTDADAGAGQGGAAGAGVHVALDPPAHLDAAPRVVRARLTLVPGALDPTTIALVSGPVGPAHLSELARHEVSAALAKRIVPALAWLDGATAVLAPTAALDAGAAYTLAVGEPPTTIALTVATADPAPLLGRVWPPASGPSGVFAIWCGDAPVPLFDTVAHLDPGALPGWIRRGAVSAGAGARCVRFEPGEADTDVARVGPPVLGAPSREVRLEPVPVQAIGAPAAVVALACSPGEIAFGPGCAIIADDRVYGRAPDAPVLWAVAGAGADAVLATGPGDPFTIAGLPPSRDVILDVAAVDAAGGVSRALVTGTTLPPMPHVIINEVLANPIGPEPAQEWVELVNDGTVVANLDGYTISDSGGDSPLPAAVLPPGAYALVVNDTYTDDGIDTPPAPGTLMLRVPHLGKNGLSNAGEALTLRDCDGNVVSRFPATPAPKAGWSVARRSPSSPDALPSSFALATPSPGRANSW